MVTIYDVAKRAQVSSMTVSRTLNNPELVRPESRAKVEAAIKELDYRKNHAARALVTQSTGIIKVQMYAALRGNHLYFSHLFAGITEVLSAHELAMLVVDQKPTSVACDGQILVGLTREAQANLKPGRTPKVLFGKGPDNLDWVDLNNAQGTYDATRYLLSLGHERIGFLKFFSKEPFIHEREAGYRRALRDAGIAIQPSWVQTGMNNAHDSGLGRAKHLLNSPDVTALVCSSDPIALGAVQAARELGASVPNDLSIVGFDGVGHELMCSPVLTTMRQPVFEIGKRLAELLVERIAEPKLHGSVQELVNAELVIGESTKACCSVSAPTDHAEKCTG